MTPKFILDRKTLDDPLYSNFDHAKPEEGDIANLRDDPTLWGQHAAFDFCGWIRYEPGGNFWVEEVWRYGKQVAVYKDDDLGILINTVLDEFGRE